MEQQSTGVQERPRTRLSKSICKSDLSAPGRENWQADADADHCTQCRVAFGYIRPRRHHCRACGLIFCSTCSGYEAEVHRSHYVQGEKKLKRVCEGCFREISTISKLADDASTIADGASDKFSDGDSQEVGPRVSDAKWDPKFVGNVNTRELSGRVWERFTKNQPVFANAVERCAYCSAFQSCFENEAEVVFSELRKGVRRCPLEDPGTDGVVVLSDVPGKVQVWRFLELMRWRRKLQRRRVDELTALLSKSEAWVEAQAAAADADIEYPENASSIVTQFEAAIASPEFQMVVR